MKHEEKNRNEENRRIIEMNAKSNLDNGFFSFTPKYNNF